MPSISMELSEKPHTLNRSKVILRVPTILALLYSMMLQRSGDVATRAGDRPHICYPHAMMFAHLADYFVQP
jgi:hypothetical protein